MSDVRIRQGDWVVVCDGAKALVLKNIGDAQDPNLKTLEVFAHDDSKTRDMGTDAPGRSSSPVGGGQSAMEQTDWHDLEEQRFLQRLATHLDGAIDAGRAKSLIIVAPPRALGVLRQAYSPQVRDKVRSEIDKDYVKMPIYEIEKHLTGR
jgi:protein required for attachment to host cells